MKAKFSALWMGIGLFGMAITVAEAHVLNSPGDSFADGFTHPWMGLDHLLAMVAVGLWAAQLGSRSTWLAPLVFLGMMAGAGLLGSAGVEIPLLESLLASSVLALGLLIALAVRPSSLVTVALVGFFALFHGYAHGLDATTMISPVGYGAGFVLATGLLHGIGLAMGVASRRKDLVARLGGCLIALTGMYLLATA